MAHTQLVFLGLFILARELLECLISPWLCRVNLPDLEALKHEDLFSLKIRLRDEFYEMSDNIRSVNMFKCDCCFEVMS